MDLAIVSLKDHHRREVKIDATPANGVVKLTPAHIRYLRKRFCGAANRHCAEMDHLVAYDDKDNEYQVVAWYECD